MPEIDVVVKKISVNYQSPNGVVLTVTVRSKDEAQKLVDSVSGHTIVGLQVNYKDD